MKKKCFLLFIFIIFFVGCNNNIENSKWVKLYDIYYNDLLNYNTSGYKARFIHDPYNPKYSNSIGNYTENTFILNFAIFFSPAFFKVMDRKTGEIFYTRYGDFTIDFDTKQVITRDKEYILLPELKIPYISFDCKAVNLMYLKVFSDNELKIYYEFKLYKPIDYSGFSQEVRYFKFDNVKETTALIENCKLEQSTTKIDAVLMKLQSILYYVKEHKVKGFNNVDFKIQLISELLQHFLQVNNEDDNTIKQYFLFLQREYNEKMEEKK